MVVVEGENVLHHIKRDKKLSGWAVWGEHIQVEMSGSRNDNKTDLFTFTCRREYFTKFAVSVTVCC